MQDTDLSGAWLHSADLSGADLRGSDVSTIDLLTTPLKGAVIDVEQAVALVGTNRLCDPVPARRCGAG